MQQFYNNMQQSGYVFVQISFYNESMEKIPEGIHGKSAKRRNKNHENYFYGSRQHGVCQKRTG